MESTIKLFKALPISSEMPPKSDMEYKELLKKTIPLGFIFSEDVMNEYTNPRLINIVDKYYGLSASKLNSTFQSSWLKIANARMEDLIVEQIIHYMTTYGKEMFVNINNNDDDNYIYIPYKDLNVPQLDIDKFKFTVIVGYTIKELKEKVLKMVGSGIALKDDTMNDLIEIMTFLDFGEKELELIKNKEIKSRMYLYLNIVPENNIEFLRLLIYKCTGKTLIIKNKETIEKIKYSSLPALELTRLFKQYNNKVGYEKLAEIFYRFKPLWLAFRQNDELKRIINGIRRWATKFHKPMKDDYLNMLTAKLYKDNNKINIAKLLDELSKVNIFRKIRLAYALKYRSNANIDSILYKVRNGKSYAITSEKSQGY